MLDVEGSTLSTSTRKECVLHGLGALMLHTSGVPVSPYNTSASSSRRWLQKALQGAKNDGLHCHTSAVPYMYMHMYMYSYIYMYRYIYTYVKNTYCWGSSGNRDLSCSISNSHPPGHLPQFRKFHHDVRPESMQQIAALQNSSFNHRRPPLGCPAWLQPSHDRSHHPSLLAQTSVAEFLFGFSWQQYFVYRSSFPQPCESPNSLSLQNYQKSAAEACVVC